MSAPSHEELKIAAARWAHEAGMFALSEWSLAGVTKRIDLIAIPTRRDAPMMMLARENEDGELTRESVSIPLDFDDPGFVARLNAAEARNPPVWFWERPGFVGIEIKASRADFRRGLKERQLETYADMFSGVYLFTVPGVAKKAELPEGIGWLVFNPETGQVRCNRHPRFVRRDEDAVELWRVLFAMESTHRRALRDITRIIREAAQPEVSGYLLKRIDGLLERNAGARHDDARARLFEALNSCIEEAEDWEDRALAEGA
jgi:hypothetical protein